MPVQPWTQNRLALGLDLPKRPTKHNTAPTLDVVGGQEAQRGYVRRPIPTQAPGARQGPRLLWCSGLSRCQTRRPALQVSATPVLFVHLDSGSLRVLDQIHAFNPNPCEMVWEVVRRGHENGPPGGRDHNLCHVRTRWEGGRLHARKRPSPGPRPADSSSGTSSLQSFKKPQSVAAPADNGPPRALEVEAPWPAPSSLMLTVCGQRESALSSEHAAFIVALPIPNNGVWREQMLRPGPELGSDRLYHLLMS